MSAPAASSTANGLARLGAWLEAAATLAQMNFKRRSGFSASGLAWTVLQPMFLFAILFLVFSQRVASDVPRYAPWLLIGIVHWRMFAAATSSAVQSIRSRRQVVLDTRFRYELLVAGDVGGATIQSAIEYALLIVVVIALSPDTLSASWLFLPFIFALQFGLTFAVGLLLCALSVRFPQTERAWSALLRVGFFAVPIFYPLSFIADPLLRQGVLANPLVHFIESARALMLNQSGWSPTGLLTAVAATVLLLLLALWVFRRAAPKFGDYL